MNVMEFDRVARDVFAPAYIALAEQIKKETGVTRGTCLDAGAGGGYLGIALARITDLEMILLDRSQEMQVIIERNIVESALGNRLHTLLGDVHDIPIDDHSVDIVISRGSVFFWENQVRAFREIYRILAPGGVTFIGGGFGSVDLKKRIDEIMMARNKNWLDMTRKRMSAHTIAGFEANLQEAGVPYQIRQIEAGFGIMIRRSV